MSYIGQGLPADSFQGFTTDSFTGDGSATTFTLSKKPFDESALLVVINNVVQKPTTNFTVSGTTLTIVGTAVADGDVIYATHMGGALPIGEAASLTSNILTSQTDIGAAIADADLFLVDDGAGGTLRKVAASRIKTYAGGALAGIDDQSSSNDDQLTITDTSVVINEDSDDVDFRVESNGSANMLFVDGGNDEVVIQKASSGATATAGSVLIVEDDDNTELSILGGSSSVLALNFGHSGDADEAIIAYNTTSGSENMSFTVGASERFRLRKGDAKTAEVTSAATTDTTSALHLSKPNETHSSSTRMIGFEVGGQGRGVILNGTSDSNAPSFSTGSDRRLKKNITAYTGGYDKIKSIPVQTWDEQFTDATGVKGWIADELETVFPDAVTGTKDATKTVTNAIISQYGNCLRDDVTEEEFNELKTKGKYANSTWSASKVVPAFQMSSPLQFFPDVVQALQAAITKIETLETKVKALEDA